MLLAIKAFRRLDKSAGGESGILRTLFVDEHQFSMNAFIREAPVEENTALECIQTVSATYGCKILRLIHM